MTTTQATVQVEMEPTDDGPEEPTEVSTVEPLPPIPGRTMTISFERNIRPADYESAKAGATTSMEVPADFPIDRLAELVEAEFTKIRSAVYQQLGIEFTYDENARRIVEAFEGSVVASPGMPAAQAPAAQANPFAQQQAAAPVQMPQAGAPQFGGTPTPQGGATPGWADLMADPSQWKDNRNSKQSERSPDFVHLTAKKTAKDGKVRDVALWINSQYDPAPPDVRAWLGIA